MFLAIYLQVKKNIPGFYNIFSYVYGRFFVSNKNFSTKHVKIV